ncbi:MAG: ATP-dependent DNA helicase RecQ [Dolichospermum sp. DET50]|nr:ATP-dependent DNA helicase RecQ [Dolichospermum sp. DET66]MBS3034878.1 ATP-dependent DNA helicase RecQ [Dolichospermum sp. DET67]MBS3040081.1 ATP-dependent DNA helicase RecQ [Dolichospermum sp. DET50]QSX67258.1 MAG: ATP-dependent DNA helicase RecQ [Dolichospermum sp. DET69]
MTDSFIKLREILKTGNIPEDISDFKEGCYQRLFNALRNKSGLGDIASLIRHILRFEDEKQDGNSQIFLQIPRNNTFPNRDIWERCGIKILSEDQDYFLISPRPWQPKWLDCTNQYPPDTPLFKEEIRRHHESANGDPFLQTMRLDKYLSIGQREAIRAVLTAPKNSTLIINLPTGSGKSLCAQLPALLSSQDGGVSVVVVPTTALAIDQERALKQFVNHPTAYYKDDSPAGKARRQGIRNRIWAGTQKIIFTSPESLMSSLASSIYEAAKSGMLQYFVIDEAHMIEQWGDDFRPAFQELPGFIRNLHNYSSFTTLLLTATLTESCLDTLESLFGQDLQVISAVQLRPEPAYWFKWCDSEEMKKQRLIEALYHLPRPLIIYATIIDDVKNLKKELDQAEFKRCSIMTGQSSEQERSQLIKDWREKNIDIVIATSAFGLGVDLADVRAVIHVCIPENINRFYQEVGRGGRDGKACLSLTLYTNKDYDVARDINDNSAITVDRGLQRWQSMFYAKETLNNGRFRFPINNPPSMETKDIDMNSEQNTTWNLRTLTLLQRAKLIDIDSEETHKFSQNTRIINIRNEKHLDPSTWEYEVEPIRRQRKAWSDKNLALMREALKAKRCLSEIFAEAYTIPSRNAPQPRNGVRVSRACGGCFVCRQKGIQTFAGIMPSPSRVWQEPKFFVGKELERLLVGNKLLLIFYESSDSRNIKERINQLFNWFIKQGIINMIVPPELRKSLINEANIIPHAFIFLWEKYQPLKMPYIPTLIFHPQGEKLLDNYLTRNNSSQAPRIIFLPIDTPDPSRPDRRLIDIFPGKQLKFALFCMEIGL